MITILLAAAGIAPRRLQMAIRVWTNPDIGPGRRNHQRSNALEDGLAADLSPLWTDVFERTAKRFTADADNGVAHINELSSFNWLQRRREFFANGLQFFCPVGRSHGFPFDPIPIG